MEQNEAGEGTRTASNRRDPDHIRRHVSDRCINFDLVADSDHHQTDGRLWRMSGSSV